MKNRTLRVVALVMGVTFSGLVVSGSNQGPPVMPAPLSASVSYNDAIECATLFNILASVALRQKTAKAFDTMAEAAGRFIDTASITHGMPFKKIREDMHARDKAMLIEVANEKQIITPLMERYGKKCTGYLGT